MAKRTIRDIYGYTGIFRGVMTHGEADEIVTKLQEFEWRKHGDTLTNVGYDPNTDFSVAHQNLDDERMTTIMNNAIDGALARYTANKSCGISHGRSLVRFNKYDTNTEMKSHFDNIHSLFDGKIKGVPTLSILGVLNDDYEGGTFVFNDHKELPLKKGDVLIFPSNFIYRHKVRLVTSGTRYSWVSWAY